MMKASLKKGFTLVEVLMAIGIITLVILTFVSSMNYSILLNANVKERMIAMNDAVLVMEQIRTRANTYGLTGANSVTDSNVVWSTGLSNNLQSESVQVTFPNGTTGDPLTTKVTINWLDKTRAQNFSLTTKVTKR